MEVLKRFSIDYVPYERIVFCSLLLAPAGGELRFPVPLVSDVHTASLPLQNKMSVTVIQRLYWKKTC